ncbi:LytR/AlgR family response regulator transcription factor [Clostridium ihumii]|uniref:LytR/AlgR family response regulator transcription factor n=1 Tax=Clostridium ihumii TaxID=1470356 RepID=UPI00058D6D7C|nr:LytTR family DNA-binding domain-containing protein [Clostridium ihumii]
MIKIAICDDEKCTCSAIENIVLEYGEEKNLEIDTEVFYSGEKLCDYLEKNDYFDIIFLDIELENLNGVEVGRFLRNTLKNQTTQVIYISSKESYAMKLFKIRPLDFLIKPIVDKEIKEVLNSAFNLIDKENEFFDFSIRKALYRIPLKEILYFTSEGKKIKIVTMNDKEEQSFYDKLEDVRDRLPKDKFLLIHKSYLVQFNYIMEYKYDCLKMINGDVLNISQSNRKEVRLKLMKHRKENK